MAVKYTIPYRSIDDTPWRVDILLDSWTDNPITVRGHGNRCCTIEWDGGVDDPFDNPVVSSKANIEIINQGELDMDELQYAAERDFVVEVYRENILKWKGYLITDNIQQPFQSTPYVVQLSAIDGLNMLEGITFSIDNLQTLPIDIAVRAPLNWIRLVLGRTQNLGLLLPIRWHVGLESVATEDDAFAGLMTWSPYGEGIEAGQYQDENGLTVTIYQNCRYILEGLVKAMGARIFQADGAWCIMRTGDIIDGSFTYKEIEATMALPTITTHTVDITRSIYPEYTVGGDYKFIREDALMTVKPALKHVDVQYDHDQRENIVPNGGFDMQTVGINWLHWGFITNPSNLGSIEQHESLTGRPGNAVQLTLDDSATNTVVYTLMEGGEIAGVPLDANILFKRLTWGFTIMPTNFGFPFDGDETIIWDSQPLAVSLRYTVQLGTGTRTYFLNEFGYWQFEARGQDLGVQFTNRATEYLGLNVDRHRMYFEGSPNVGDVLVVGIRSNPGGAYTEYEFTVGALQEGNLELALDGLLTAIPTVINGRNIQNRAVGMDNPTRGYVRFSDFIFYGYPTGRTYKSGATQEYRLIFPEMQGLKIWDVANFVFQGKAGSNEILIPDPGNLNREVPESVGKLDIRFRVMPGQRYVLDDVWVRVEDNKDVYRAETTNEGLSQHITLGISSSFSGFMVSNLMRSYNTSNEDFLFTDGITEASLTEHYARSVMRWRYKPSKIFNGTINTRGADWSFFEVYSIYSLTGGNFLPLKASYNTELCEVNLVAMEGRDDGVVTDVKHYASNNMPLSNYGG